jgi:hypothetical protein
MLASTAGPQRWAARYRARSSQRSPCSRGATIGWWCQLSCRGQQCARGFRCGGLRAGGLPRPTASSAAGPAVWWSARGDRFGRSGVEAFATPAEGPGEPSELDSALEGDGPSARATPLANPTANALRGQLHTSRPVGMHCIQLTAGSVLIWQCRLKIAVRAVDLRVARPCLQSSRC